MYPGPVWEKKTVVKKVRTTPKKSWTELNDIEYSKPFKDREKNKWNSGGPGAKMHQYQAEESEKREG